MLNDSESGVGEKSIFEESEMPQTPDSQKLMGLEEVNKHIQQYIHPQARRIINTVAAAIKKGDSELDVFLNKIPLLSTQFPCPHYATDVKQFIKNGFLKMAEANAVLFPAEARLENNALLRNAICMEICVASDIFHFVNVGRDKDDNFFIDPNHQTFGIPERFSSVLPEQHIVFLIPTKNFMDQLFLSGFGARMESAATKSPAEPSL